MSIFREARSLLNPGVAVLILWHCAIGIEQLAAMPQGGGTEETSVDLGFDIGEAGVEVSLSIQLKAPDGVQVGTTVNDVAFPTKWLQFQEVRVGPSTEAKVASSLKLDGENQGEEIVTVTVTAVQDTTLTNGIVAFVVFKVAEEVPEAQVVKLKNVARALNTSVPPSPIEPVTGRDGEIELLASTPAIIVCFFYMH